MSNRQKAQGTRWEREVLEAVHDAGYTDAYRLAEHGTKDQGDLLIGSRKIVLECKDRERLNIHDTVAKASRKADGWTAAVVWKRRARKEGNTRRHTVGEPIVALTLTDFLEIIR